MVGEHEQVELVHREYTPLVPVRVEFRVNSTFFQGISRAST